MQRIHLTLPLSVGALLVWLSLTLGVGWLETGGRQQSLGEAAGGHIGLSWLLAALFALALVLASDDWRGAGLRAPQPLSSARLAWPPLLYALLMLAVAWAGGFPARGVLLVIACNTAVVALSEELMFRAILLQGFLDRLAIWPGVMASSAIFGLVHAANGYATGDVGAALWQSAAAFLQGVAYAAIRLRTRSIWPMVVVHGLWDFSLMTATLSAAADGEVSSMPYLAMLAVLPLFLYGLYLLRGNQGQLKTLP